MTNNEERTVEKDGYRIDVVFFFGMVCSFGAAMKTPLSTRHYPKSLYEFYKKCPSRIGERILLYTNDYQEDEAITYLPVYYAAHM